MNKIGLTLCAVDCIPLYILGIVDKTSHMTKELSLADVRWAHDVLASRLLTQKAVSEKLGVSVYKLRQRLKAYRAEYATEFGTAVMQARALYASLSQQMHELMGRLRENSEEKGVSDLIRLHAKSLLALAAAERDVSKAIADYESTTRDDKTFADAPGLDLELARDEIYRRLACLREDTQTDSSAAGNAE